MAILKSSVISLINIQEVSQIRDIEKRIDEKISLSYQKNEVLTILTEYSVTKSVENKIQQIYEKAGWTVSVKRNAFNGHMTILLS